MAYECKCMTEANARIKVLEEAIKDALDEDCGGWALGTLVDALGYDPRMEDK